MSRNVTIDIESIEGAIRRYRLSCVHGASAAATLLSGPAASDDVVVDILFARHRTAHDCTCAWPVAAANGTFAGATPAPHEMSA